MSRQVRAGETIKLRARFKDDLGVPAEATSVYVHIFQPDIEEFDNLGEATVVSGEPQYLGQGIFEYSYTVPNCGPDGMWHDSWEGLIACQEIDSVLTFEVTASGEITSVGSQLGTNDLVTVTLESGIESLDGGSILEDEWELEFLTETAPDYSSVRKVRLEIGAFISGLPDDVIQMNILEASIEADTLSFAPTQVNDDMFQHARRQYVTCLAAKGLAGNVLAGSLRTKTLGDLHVEYDTNALRDALADINDCLEKWAPQLMAGGAARAAQNPKYVVKGERDVDRPAVSRMWHSTEHGAISRRIPAANDRKRPVGSRRHLRTYSGKPKKWW